MTRSFAEVNGVETTLIVAQPERAVSTVKPVIGDEAERREKGQEKLKRKENRRVAGRLRLRESTAQRFSSIPFISLYLDVNCLVCRMSPEREGRNYDRRTKVKMAIPPPSRSRRAIGRMLSSANSSMERLRRGGFGTIPPSGWLMVKKPGCGLTLIC
jgi:hypothetical protein